MSVTGKIELHATRCPICGTEGNALELYPANFDSQAFNSIVFSARRLPDRIHYRMVRCNNCGLVRSDPIANPEVLGQLYTKSTFDYADEIQNLRITYGHYLAKLADYGSQKDTLLEIGCGNGFFLEEALAQGYATVRGVEPSISAVAKANSRVQPYIVCDVVRPKLFEPEQFDVICMFQVLDHLPDPNSVIEECFHLLKPGGLILCINHNVEALSARILRNRSPIIDIEHTYLYNPATMQRIFAAQGFQVKRVGAVYNTYSLYYLIRLIPLPIKIKRLLLDRMENTLTGNARLRVPLGNLYLIAQRPDARSFKRNP